MWVQGKTVFGSLQQRLLLHLKPSVCFVPALPVLCMALHEMDARGVPWKRLILIWTVLYSLLPVHVWPLNSSETCASNPQAGLLHLHSLCCWASALPGVQRCISPSFTLLTSACISVILLWPWDTAQPANFIKAIAAAVRPSGGPIPEILGMD